MQDDADLRQQVLSASTADEVANLAVGFGYEFSGDELLRISGPVIFTSNCFLVPLFWYGSWAVLKECLFAKGCSRCIALKNLIFLASQDGFEYHCLKPLFSKFCPSSNSEPFLSKCRMMLTCGSRS